MPETLVMTGKTISGGQETLNFGGHTPNYAFKLISFKLWGSNNLGNSSNEHWATLTRAKTIEDPANPNFDNEGLVGVATLFIHNSPAYPPGALEVINPMAIITQDCLLAVEDTADGDPINWMLIFEKVKLTNSAEAVLNFKQFGIFDD